MSTFLTEDELARAIKDILSGDDVRCAVAYWGSGIHNAFARTSGPPVARIICDVSRGGTSPNALINLGAPNNENLRHVLDLHAKVYISERGAVVGSANASSNGIGFDTAPGLIEAGVFLDPANASFNAATSWFETLWKISKKVDKAALDMATKRFRPSGSPGQRTLRPGSLLDQIAAEPDRFSGISIVLVQRNTEPQERVDARADMKTAFPGETEGIARMPDDGMFIGWKRKDVARWHRAFIEFWMPREKLFCYGRKASYFNEQTGTVMSVKYWPAVKALIEGEVPEPADISLADHDLVRRLLGKYGDVIFSAQELSVSIDLLP